VELDYGEESPTVVRSQLLTSEQIAYRAIAGRGGDIDLILGDNEASLIPKKSLHLSEMDPTVYRLIRQEECTFDFAVIDNEPKNSARVVAFKNVAL
jgi:hypothetical protein